MADIYITALQDQAAHVDPAVRQAIGEAFRRAKVTGFTDFNELLLTVVGHALAGKITPEQVKAVTPLLELLFASVSAQTMREDAWRMNRVQSDPDDPMGKFLDAASQGATTIRPMLEMSDDGDNSFTMTATGKDGNKVTVARMGYPRDPSNPSTT